MSAHGEHETANEQWASLSVTAPAAHAPQSTRLRPPLLHGSAVDSEVIQGTPMLATVHFRSIHTAALKIVAAEAREEEVS